MRIFVTGATGFIGSRLVRDLLRRGDRVAALSRSARRMAAMTRRNLLDGGDRVKVLEGDPLLPGPWQEEAATCDAVIALQGEPIAGRRYTESVKQRLIDSRVEGVRRICEALARRGADLPTRTFLCGSAVGYYGPRGDEPLDEDSPAGEGFLADLCRRWEAAAQEALPSGVRVVSLRIGVVLGPGGGALARMLPAFRLGLGGRVGSGRQYVSWVHMSDATGIIQHCLDRPEITGPVNVTAPTPVTMAELARTLGEVLHRPALLPVPAPLVRLALGEGADVLLHGQRVLPRKALAQGYRFHHPDLRSALSEILG